MKREKPDGIASVFWPWGNWEKGKGRWGAEYCMYKTKPTTTWRREKICGNGSVSERELAETTTKGLGSSSQNWVQENTLWEVGGCTCLVSLKPKPLSVMTGFAKPSFLILLGEESSLLFSLLQRSWSLVLDSWSLISHPTAWGVASFPLTRNISFPQQCFTFLGFLKTTENAITSQGIWVSRHYWMPQILPIPRSLFL